MKDINFYNKLSKSQKDLYDYSLVEYKNNRTKIKIICKKHGIFEQSPYKHLCGQGCPKCKGKYKTTSDIIKEFKLVHNNKYDYSLVKYKNAKDKVSIICKEHGVFEQTTESHLYGKGCYKCNGGVKYTTEDFINISKKIHSNKYDYSLVKYKNAKDKVSIICKEHGVFEQIPNNHISKKYGCPTCSNKYKTTESFIKISNIVHNNIYDYTNVNYVNGRTKVKIGCRNHGIFNQSPEKHLNGQGCPICNKSKGESEIISFLNNKNIPYISEKKFDGCVNKNHLPFDFYLPEYNMCIEYDGVQHFKPIEFFGGIEGFKLRVENDRIKTKFCSDNYIKLLRIKYTEIEKIKEIIYEKLENI